jgi:hypothetical protein
MTDESLKVTRPAMERNEDRCDLYQLQVGENFQADQLVFLDESACNRITTKRAMAWARVGCRARRHDYFVRGHR